MVDWSIVRVFWDTQNCAIPRQTTLTEIVSRLRHALASLAGRLSLALYVDNALYQAWEEEGSLNQVEMILIEDKSKDSIDKRIIADLGGYAYDCLQEGVERPVIVLISTDVDFSYSLSQWKKRGLTIVLFKGKTYQSREEDSHLELDWYSFVRGAEVEEEVKRLANSMHSVAHPVSPSPSEEQVTPALIEKVGQSLDDMINQQRLKVDEKSLRAALGFDGVSKQSQWDSCFNHLQVQELYHKAVARQKSLPYFDPSAASWDSFSITTLPHLYNLLWCYRHLPAFKGKYPTAIWLVARYQEIPRTSGSALYVGQALEFIELALQVGWLQKEGSKVRINPNLLVRFPVEEVVDGPKERSSHQVIATSTVQLVHAKSALQYYFQTTFHNISLLKYNTRQLGPAHQPTFETNVLVYLPPGNNWSCPQSFYAFGTGSTLRQAEKQAALQACQRLIQFLPNFFPTQFCLPS